MLHLLEEEKGDSVTEMQTVVEDVVGRMPRGHIMKALWIQTRTWEFICSRGATEGFYAFV